MCMWQSVAVPAVALPLATLTMDVLDVDVECVDGSSAKLALALTRLH